jgi:hypothetical protein
MKTYPLFKSQYSLGLGMYLWEKNHLQREILMHIMTLASPFFLPAPALGNSEKLKTEKSTVPSWTH